MEDFNLPSAERIALLDRLQESIGDVPPHFWAACQVCHLDSLENLVNCGRDYPNILRGFTLQTRTMAHYWGPTPPRALSQASTPNTATPNSAIGSSSVAPPIKKQSRNQKVRGLAEDRDRFKCVLTGDGSTQVAHIYPYHSISYQEADEFGQRHIFWDHLKNFWPQEKITAWEAELFPAGLNEPGVERVYNLITLSHTAHDLWARGAFALKPISESEDKTTLKVQFFWQKKPQGAHTAMSLSTRPCSTEGLAQNTDVRNVSVRLFQEAEGGLNAVAIRSGDYFTIQTNDPETKPLPSFAILELQWFLQRVIGMAGAADVYWPSLSDSGSDISEVELPGLEVDEDEDSFFSQPLGSPSTFLRNNNLNLLMLPKYQEAQGEGEGVEQGREVTI